MRRWRRKKVVADDRLKNCKQDDDLRQSEYIFQELWPPISSLSRAVGYVNDGEEEENSPGNVTSGLCVLC